MAKKFHPPFSKYQDFYWDDVRRDFFDVEPHIWVVVDSREQRYSTHNTPEKAETACKKANDNHD